MENKIKALEKWVTENYRVNKLNWSSERSMGNCDDCFNDGSESGTSWAAYEIANILGMEIERPVFDEDEE